MSSKQLLVSERARNFERERERRKNGKSETEPVRVGEMEADEQNDLKSRIV